MAEIIYELVANIWNTETLPAEFLEGAIVHKKGDKLECENYRGIVLLNTVYKVFAKVLHSLLCPHAETVIGERFVPNSGLCR